MSKDPVQEYPQNTPEEVGICVVCKRIIYDYELSQEGCDCSPGDSIHKDCLVVCYACGHKGCKRCLEADDVTGEYLCDEQDCRDRFALMLEKEEWEYQLKRLENHKASVLEPINLEMDVIGKEIDEINQKLKEYE